MLNGKPASSDRLEPQFLTPDTKLVMVVGPSRINQIVISKIAERAGLKALAEAPGTDVDILKAKEPAMIIVDHSPDDAEWARLIEPLAERRNARAERLPFVILLSHASGKLSIPDADSIIDIVLQKPIMPDRLQPILQKLAEQIEV